MLGESWAVKLIERLFRGAGSDDSTRKLAQHVILTVVNVDVGTTIGPRGKVSWNELGGLWTHRNRIVHAGEMAQPGEGAAAVDLVAGLWTCLVPAMRDLCGVRDSPGYTPPSAA